MRLGFIGTGTIAAAFIDGLRHGGHDEEIVLSPRSEVTAAALAARHADVSRAASNVDVAERSDIVFLAMRPAQVEEALEGIVFRPEQIVVSFVAGLPLPELQQLAPGSRVCRVLPLPAIAHGAGPVLCLPPLPEIMRLLDGLGDVIVPESEAQWRKISGISAFMSSYFELQQRLIGWLGDSGVEPQQASLYVRSLLLGLAQTGRATSDAELANLPEEHQTKGGLNQRTRALLDAEGWFDRPAAAFEEIAKLKRDNLK